MRVRPDDIATALGAALVSQRPLTGGVSARILALELESPDGPRRTVVARSFGSERADTVRREFAILRALQGRFPVPEPLLLDESGAYFVMEYVDGSTDITPDAHVLNTMADTLARLHAFDVEALSLPDLPALEDPRREIHRYLPAEARELQDIVEAFPSWTTTTTLLHGDYWPGNLIWRDASLAAVVDWEGASLGDPASDVAGARCELRCAYGPQAVEAFTERYCAQRPIDLERLAVWDAYVSASALAFLSTWGLPPQDEHRRRTETQAFLDEAQQRLRPRSVSPS